MVHKFGLRVRDLRKQAGMSQRELSSKVKVNFTYLSKIESGVMDPPSEEVIIKIAKILDTDKDELITLAGKVPSDVSNILRKKGVLQFLRSSNSDEIIRKLLSDREKE